LEIAEYERGRYKAFPKGVWTGDFMNNDSMNSLTCQVYYQFGILSNARKALIVLKIKDKEHSLVKVRGASNLLAA